ncbi:FAD dependent oxidoreductase [Bordetella trematum]|nr:FAD dependent oxidoreductase [Bordetella trematum]
MQKQLPNTVDVAIIGAGIIGISTAWALARAGLRVAVFEKGAIGAEQSSRNWGWIRSVKRDHCELPLALRANALWQALQQQVDVGYRQRGLAYLGASAAEMEGYAKWLQAARPYGISARLVEAQALPALLGAPSARDWQGRSIAPRMAWPSRNWPRPQSPGWRARPAARSSNNARRAAWMWPPGACAGW